MDVIYLRWTRQVLLNLVIVAAAGTLLRCKIVFPIPFIDHKNLMHAHSHFAFSGWISLAIFVCIVSMLQPAPPRKRLYAGLFCLGQLAAFGMLLSFPFMGYKHLSIFFSTLSILFSYAFAIIAWKDIDGSSLSSTLGRWFKAALFFYVISSLGAFHLAWLMARGDAHQQWYIGSVYFFLHFQYNGWFLFAILGLFYRQLQISDIAISEKKVRIIFRLLFISCFPCFLLSALWMQLPSWMYLLSLVGVLLQAIALVLFWSVLVQVWLLLRQRWIPVTRLLWSFAAFAFTLKVIMQTLSVIPQLSYLAFGFRPVVIGYLHLILVCFATFFIIGYQAQQNLISNLSGRVITGLKLFTGGVVLNELLLFLQGLAAIMQMSFSPANYLLLVAACIMFSGLLLLYMLQHKSKNYKYEIPFKRPSGPISISD